jgi:hypothetical protein
MLSERKNMEKTCMIITAEFGTTILTEQQLECVTNTLGLKESKRQIMMIAKGI